MFERIERFEGLFIALYACEMGELGEKYLGHYKIFPARPLDFWVSGHIAADIAGALSASANDALNEARDLARQHARRLAPQRMGRLAERAAKARTLVQRPQPQPSVELLHA